MKINRTGTALVLAAALAGCQKSNVDVQPERDDTGSSVKGSSYASIGKPEDTIDIAAATLLDRQTGCEYVVTSLGKSSVSAAPRVVPDAEGTPSQRCGRPSDLDGYAWLGSADDALPVRVSVIRDRRMGCEYVVGTIGVRGSFTIPRMMRRDDGQVVQRCLSAT